MKTPPAPSEDLLFSPLSQDAGQDAGSTGSVPSAPSHASSSDSGMSDERNADSVLFQLDTLSAMQSQKKPGGAPRQLARLAAPTPQSEAGSGLIDLRTLGGNPGALEESAEAAPLGAELATSAELSQSTLLSSSSMSATVSRANGAQVPGVPAQLPSRTPLIILSVLALVALAAAVTAIILRG